MTRSGRHRPGRSAPPSSARRSSCQAPRPTRTITPSSAATPGTRSFLTAVIGDSAGTRRSTARRSALLSAPVAVLLGDEEALERAEQAERQDENQRHPEQHMQPERRLEGELDDQRQADDDEADDHDDEDCRPVTGIGEGIIQPAGFAARLDAEEAVEETALAAARTASAKTGLAGRLGRIERFVLHYSASGAPQPPRCRWKRTGRARPRRRSASTRRPPRSRNAASA